MADFVQTMKDWRRMCQHMDKEYGNSCCDNCPLGGCSAVYEDDVNTDYAEIEGKVAAWAAEHPEPVYPTWFKWLEDVGIVFKAKSEYSQIYDTVLPTFKMFDPIPADIAKKLGIELKEV